MSEKFDARLAKALNRLKPPVRKNTANMRARGKLVVSIAIRGVDALSANPYDGIAGELPNWMPGALKVEFSQIRTALIGGPCGCARGKHSHSEVRRWLRTGDSPSVIHAPNVHALSYIQRIAGLGPKNGIEAHLGKGPAEIYRKRNISEEQSAKAKKPRADGLRQVIISILARKPPAEKSLPYVLRELADLAGRRSVVDGVEISAFESVKKDGDACVVWSDHPNRSYQTPISALKDRVRRAEKKLGLSTGTTRRTLGR